MNYRHIFHAGNPGDVVKHVLLIQLLRAMQRKEKGFLFLDTHAGIGSYDLGSNQAKRTAEHANGIGRLWTRQNPPAALLPYLELVRAHQLEQGDKPPVMRYYPGSPVIAAKTLRPQDHMALSENHPDDYQALRENMRRHGRFSIQCIDAYAALRAHLPPAEKRALVLIDPPYEDHNEIARLHAGLTQALQRFSSGVYAVWYPIKDRSATEAFRAVMQTLPLPPTLAIELTLRADDRADQLNGCGLLVLNPPWQIAAELEPIVGALREALAEDSSARSDLVWLREED